MRADEFLNEAHHHRIITRQIGTWTVHIDTHLIATIADRDIVVGDVVNILSFACRYVPELKTIPLGKGAYFQDTNTLVSLYLKRSQHYPNEITLETVLSPTQAPTPPLFRRSVPQHDMPDTPKIKAGKEMMRQYTQTLGRDAVSQDLETLAPKINAKQYYTAPETEVPLNREQRRALNKYLRKQ